MRRSSHCSLLRTSLAQTPKRSLLQTPPPCQMLVSRPALKPTSNSCWSLMQCLQQRGELIYQYFNFVILQMLLIVLVKSKENTGTIPEKKLNLVRVNKNVGLNLNSNQFVKFQAGCLTSFGDCNNACAYLVVLSSQSHIFVCKGLYIITHNWQFI